MRDSPRRSLHKVLDPLLHDFGIPVPRRVGLGLPQGAMVHPLERQLLRPGEVRRGDGRYSVPPGCSVPADLLVPEAPGHTGEHALFAASGRPSRYLEATVV